VTGTGGAGDLYELLGVRRDATAAEITRACHRRARALHPDTQPGQAGQAGEPARFRELEAAYRVLHDPARRAAYDQALHQATGTPAPPPRRGRPAPAWPSPAGWPAARPPGAMLWAAPVQVTRPGSSSPGVTPARFWLAAALAEYLAGDPGAGPGWGWPW
jgi:curved DNA-binding protein CbpA